MKIKYKSPKRYRCDPDKNVGCPKNICYRKYLKHCKYTEYCMYALNKEYKMSLFKRIKERIFGWK